LAHFLEDSRYLDDGVTVKGEERAPELAEPLTRQQLKTDFLAEASVLLFRRVFGCALIVAAISSAGCRSASRSLTNSAVRMPPAPSVAKTPMENVDDSLGGHIVPTSAEISDQVAEPETITADELFGEERELQLENLIAIVQSRNPSLQASISAWAAAAERYPQAIALDDPMLQSMFAPASFGPTSPVQSSYYIGGAQRVPWHGKRELRGEIAKWEAVAASWDAEEVKLRLAAATRIAYFDYYLVHRQAELNEKNVGVLQDFRSTAKAKYEANQVSQQDLSTADLELAKLEQQRLELRQSLKRVVARINTLLHRCPDHSLPPPVKLLSMDIGLPDALSIREMAWQHRPELSALAAKIQSEQNAVALACKDYYPDFEFMARYDAFWTDAVQRGQVGMNMNVPLNQRRRAAAVREAQFRVGKLRAEYNQQRDSVAEEVQVALASVEASRDSVLLFEERILQAAETNLDTARAAYEAGSIDFLRVMEARKQYIEQQIGYHQKLAEFHRSRAELERAVGAPIMDL
jgi:outer membrane protein TolC